MTTVYFLSLIQMKRVDGKDACLKSFASWPNRAQSSPHKPRNAPWHAPAKKRAAKTHRLRWEWV